MQNDKVNDKKRCIILSPAEATGFQKCVMAAFENREFVRQWERLRKQRLITAGYIWGKNYIQSQDKRQAKAINLFIKDARNLIWDRLTADAWQEFCR